MFDFPVFALGAFHGRMWEFPTIGDPNNSRILIIRTPKIRYP